MYFPTSYTPLKNKSLKHVHSYSTKIIVSTILNNFSIQVALIFLNKHDTYPSLSQSKVKWNGEQQQCTLMSEAVKKYTEISTVFSIV